MSFCENLREYRRLAGLTQAEVAQRCHISTVSYCNYENGKTFPHNMQVIKDICSALDIEESQLFSDIQSSRINTDEEINNDSFKDEASYSEVIESIERVRKILFSDNVSSFNKHFLASSVFKTVFEFYNK